MTSFIEPSNHKPEGSPASESHESDRPSDNHSTSATETDLKLSLPQPRDELAEADTSGTILPTVSQEAFIPTLQRAIELQDAEMQQRAAEAARELLEQLGLSDSPHIPSPDTQVSQSNIHTELDRFGVKHEFWNQAVKKGIPLDARKILAKVTGAVERKVTQRQVEEDSYFQNKIATYMADAAIPQKIKNLLTSIDRNPEEYSKRGLKELLTFSVGYFDQPIFKDGIDLLPPVIGVTTSMAVLTLGSFLEFATNQKLGLSAMAAAGAFAPVCTALSVLAIDHLARRRIKNSLAFKECLKELADLGISEDQVRVKLISRSGSNLCTRYYDGFKFIIRIK